MKDWRIYHGKDTQPHNEKIPEAPPWRSPRKEVSQEDVQLRHREAHANQQAQQWKFYVSQEAIDMVNAALYLRRPLLISGKPGSGKSSLAQAVAHELMLGPVFRWSITSSTKLLDGLYHYDAMGRLHDVSIKHESSDIGEYIRLGPLGSALIPSARPRVLLIDEIDKSDIDLPNDLLHIFEEGEFEIPELVRYKANDAVKVYYDKSGFDKVTINKGRIVCREFPFIVLTSNEERQFPAAFQRRCLRMKMKAPNSYELLEIVKDRFKDRREIWDVAEVLIQEFVEKRESARGDLATDQLLNVVHLISSGINTIGEDKDAVLQMIQMPLNS